MSFNVSTVLLEAGRNWSRDTPRQLEQHGLTLRQSLTLAQTPPDIRTGLPDRDRLMLGIAATFNLPDFANYRVNLCQAAPET